MTTPGAAVERMRRESGALVAESLHELATPPPEGDAELRRRITYLMLFRLVLFTLVLGATTVLSWLSDVDLARPGTVILFVVIGGTYLLTLLYAVLLHRGVAAGALASGQLVTDLAVSTLLVHVTGGAQSAYSFFLPLTIIGAATVLTRRHTLTIAAAAAVLFLAVAVLGWMGVLPALPGQRIRPIDLTAIELVRSLGLNLAAIGGVSVLALNLSGQLQAASDSLASHRLAAADLLTLHGDIVRCLSSGLITVDPAGLILTVNDVACDILERTAAEIVGTPIEATLPGLGVRTRTLGAAGSINRAELAVALPGGRSLVLGISVSPLKSATGHYLGRVINFQDLTDLRKMEQNVKRAERLAVVGGMAAGVAHEIRNPLASISGSVELLRTTPQGDDDSRALMDIVTREIDRLNGLLTELLDYTNPRPPKITPVDLRQLIRDTAQVFVQDRGFATVALASELPEAGNFEVAADPAKLRQVLWNLLRNGAEAASRGGGHVTVRLAASPEAVELAVIDDGPGISPEHRERIFDPFFTTKTKGHGLGLATVQSIVSEHGGTVRVDSEAGSGACFTVRLPYNQPHGG